MIICTMTLCLRYRTVLVLLLTFLLLPLLSYESAENNNLSSEGDSALWVTHHAMEKRAESNSEPHFKTGDLIVDEFVGMVMVCVVGGEGTTKRTLAIFTVMGVDEQCPIRSCPSATVNVDYVRLFETQFEIKEGEHFCRNITIINDRLIEGREFFTVILEDQRWGEIIETIHIVIEDEDSPTFTAPTHTIREDGGSVSVCIRGGNTNETVTVAVQTANSSDVNNAASLNEDYSYVYEVISISEEEEVCTQVPILDDILYEGFESFEVLMYPLNGSRLDYAYTITRVFIEEDDNAPQFGVFNRLVNENDGSAMVCVEFIADTAITVESTLTTMSYTAIAGLDFEPLNETFMIQGGDNKCFSIILHDDVYPEQHERIDLKLDSSINVIGYPFTERLTIADDDVLDFVETSYNVTEGNPPIQLCVGLVSGVNSVINGTIKTSSYNALALRDYIDIDQTFSLGGDSEKCFRFIALNDNIPEYTETVLATVYSLSSFGQILERRFVLISIFDDDVDLCGPLLPPENGEVLVFTNGRRARSIVIYTCTAGYEIVGSALRFCQLDATWSEQEPTCQAIMCPQLNDPAFGMVELTGRSIQSKALYSCIRGYRLEGDQERECLLSGRWSGPEPTCSTILCPELPDITDGVVIITTRTVDSLAVYNCSSGFELVGMEKRLCLEDGTWNGTEPICKATIDVPMPGAVGVQFVKETPKLNGRNVTVEFVTSGPTDTVICQLGSYSVTEDFTYRNSGNMTFPNMEPGVYTLIVTGSNSKSGETAKVERFFELNGHPDFCGLHLINDGLTVTGNSIHVQFAGVPSKIETFRCKLDNKPGFDCSGEVNMYNIKPGAHRLKIMHNRHECGPRRKLFLHFTIE